MSIIRQFTIFDLGSIERSITIVKSKDCVDAEQLVVLLMRSLFINIGVLKQKQKYS